MGFLSFFKSIKNRVTGKSKKNSESGSASGATAPSGDAAPRSTTSSRRQQESKKTSQSRSKATPRSSAQLSVAAPTTAQASAASNLRLSSEQTDVQHSLHHTSSLPSSAVNRSLFADAVVTPTSERLQPSLPCTPKSSSAGVLEMSPSLSIDLSNSGSSSVVGGSMEESGRGPPQLVSVEKLVPTSTAQPPPAAPKLISAPKSARTSWCAPPPSPTEEDASLAHRRGRQYSELLKKCRDDVRSVIVESYALSRPPKAAPQSCANPAAQTSLFHQARLIRQAELSRMMMQDTRGEDERAGGAQSSVRSPLSDEVSPSSVHSASICFESDEHSEEVVGGEDVAITDPSGGATNTVRTIDVSDEPSRGVQSPPMLSSQTQSDEVLDGIRRSEASLNPSSDDDGADVDDDETLRSWTNLPSPTVPLSEGEMQLLHEIDAKVVALGTRIQRHDEELCRDKDSREYWRRLYHANNTRQSEQRAEWSRQYDYLKEMRQKVVRGVLQQEAQREIRRRRREKQQLQRRDCVYNRLYNKRLQQPETAHPSPREKSKSPRPRQRRPAHDDPPVHDRLYTMGIGLMQRQEEQRQRAEAARQHQEWEDWMVVRLEAQMRHQQVYARGAVSRRTVEEREHVAREQIRQAVAVGGEKEAMKLLKTSEKERAEICEAAERLSHFGAVDAGKREEKRRAKEMAGCTFTPRVNDSLPGQARSTQHACDELYTRAVEQRKRKEQQLELVERAQKIDLLRSRMETDHHFRTRVQLDPSLAERYVMGLE